MVCHLQTGYVVSLLLKIESAAENSVLCKHDLFLWTFSKYFRSVPQKLFRSMYISLKDILFKAIVNKIDFCASQANWKGFKNILSTMLYFHPMPHAGKSIPYDAFGFVFWHATLLNSDNFHKDMMNVLMDTHQVNKHRSPFSPRCVLGTPNRFDIFYSMFSVGFPLECFW